MLACPLCGAGSGLELFALILGVFVLMLLGTVLLFLASWWRGDWGDARSRFDALRAEEDA